MNTRLSNALLSTYSVVTCPRPGRAGRPTRRRNEVAPLAWCHETAREVERRRRPPLGPESRYLGSIRDIDRRPRVEAPVATARSCGLHPARRPQHPGSTSDSSTYRPWYQSAMLVVPKTICGPHGTAFATSISRARLGRHESQTAHLSRRRLFAHRCPGNRTHRLGDTRPATRVLRRRRSSSAESWRRHTLRA